MHRRLSQPSESDNAFSEYITDQTDMQYDDPAGANAKEGEKSDQRKPHHWRGYGRMAHISGDLPPRDSSSRWTRRAAGNMLYRLGKGAIIRAMTVPTACTTARSASLLDIVSCLSIGSGYVIYLISILTTETCLALDRSFLRKDFVAGAGSSDPARSPWLVMSAPWSLRPLRLQ